MPLRLGLCSVVSAVFRGEVVDSAVLLPASDCSSGICTLSFGRGPPPTRRLLDREGGVNVVSGMVGTELRALPRFDVFDLCGSGGDEVALLREMAPTSTDCARLPPASSFTLRGSPKDAKCCDRMDRFSSMGVNMLCCLRCGSFLMAEFTSRRGLPDRSGLGSGFGSIGAGG